MDSLRYNAADPAEGYSAADTMKYAGTISLTTGHAIYSDMGRRFLTIAEDTCGRHDTIGGYSAASNQLRYGVADTPSCRQNFLRALEPFGVGKKDIMANLRGIAPVQDPLAVQAILAHRARSGPPPRRPTLPHPPPPPLTEPAAQSLSRCCPCPPAPPPHPSARA